MGEGLNRAFAAAARTRADASLTPEMRRFLERLAPHSKPVTRTALGCASEAEIKIRAACKRLGYAKFHRLRAHESLGWQITPLGRKMLASTLPSGGEG